MPADFMTKATERKKVDASVAYATNSANAVPIGFKDNNGEL